MSRLRNFFTRKPYKVKLLGRSGILYREGERTLMIESEMLPGTPYHMALYISLANHWEPPFASDEIPREEKDRIFGNIQRDLHRLRIDRQ